MTGEFRERTRWLRALASLFFCIATCLILACSPAMSKPPASAPSLTDKLFAAPDEDLFCEGFAHLGLSGALADDDRAAAAFTTILQSYPKSKWADPASSCLGFIKGRRAMLEKCARDQGLIDALRQEKEEALRSRDSLKLANEKLQAEVERRLQENEQLKKDIQLLKELEVELEKRDRMLR